MIKKKVLLSSLDIYRPAAIEQLNQLAKSIEIDYMENNPNDKIANLVKNSFSKAKQMSHDIIIFDTAGRTTVDVTLMEELKSELNFNEIADVMQAINQQAVKAGAGMVFDIQAATAARTKDTQFRGSSYQFDKDFDVSDYQYQTPANDFIFRQGQAPMKFNKNDLVIGGTNLGGSGDGKVAALLERLVSAVEAGGDVIMDGNKVGTTIAMTKSKFK